MSIRTRTRPQVPVNGYWVQVGGIPCKNTIIPIPVYERAEVCVDDTAPGDNHFFEVTTSELKGTHGRDMGTLCGGVPGLRSVDFCPSSLRNMVNNTTTGFGAHATTPTKPSNGALAATLLARTNPSRPVVDVPVFVGELRELPLLFKRFGDNLVKNFADANLRYQFGIVPLVKDLSSLLNFSDEFEKRAREIEALFEGGLRRKIALGTYSGSESSPSIQTSSGAPGTTFHSYNKITSDEVHGFCRWKPSSKMPTTSAERRALARRAVLGLTVDFSTFWNLMPWSWMIDWCSSMGDFLMAKRNIIPAYPTDICILSRRRTDVSFNRVGGTYRQGECQSYNYVRTSKRRDPASPTLSAQLPGLSLRQLSILGSIAVQRYR